jgi:hypothetical protein
VDRRDQALVRQRVLASFVPDAPSTEVIENTVPQSFQALEKSSTAWSIAATRARRVGERRACARSY